MIKQKFKTSLVLMALLGLSSAAKADVIDVHSHYIGQEYVDYLTSHDAQLKEGFPLPKWSEQQLEDFMQRAKINTAVLSLAPVHPYLNEKSVEFIRTLNEHMAELKRSHTGKYLFCATLPLTDVKAAISETEYVYDKLQADAVLLGSNIDGQYLGDSELEPLMEKLNQYHSVVIVHPHKPYGLSDSIFKQIPLAMFEYPADTTRAVVNLTLHNVMVRYPNIRFVIPHAGSFLGAAIPRMKAIYPVVRAQGLLDDLDIEANLKGLYFDLAGVKDLATVRNMLSFTDTDHILYGSDFPYFKAEVLIDDLQSLEEQFKADPVLSEEFDKIMYKNAEKLFQR